MTNSCLDARDGTSARGEVEEARQEHVTGIGSAQGGRQTLVRPPHAHVPTPVAAQTDPGPVSSSQSSSLSQPVHATKSGAQIVRDVPVAQAQSRPQNQVGPSAQ